MSLGYQMEPFDLPAPIDQSGFRRNDRESYRRGDDSKEQAGSDFKPEFVSFPFT
jgi:hypothetical protein